MKSDQFHGSKMHCVFLTVEREFFKRVKSVDSGLENIIYFNGQ